MTQQKTRFGIFVTPQHLITEFVVTFAILTLKFIHNAHIFKGELFYTFRFGFHICSLDKSTMISVKPVYIYLCLLEIFGTIPETENFVLCTRYTRKALLIARNSRLRPQIVPRDYRLPPPKLNISQNRYRNSKMRKTGPHSTQLNCK